ncbi:MAG TPA: UbiH/UbiF/VisC/COQ6 family ubiquinone biosynthesis hydroxylase [Caulobacteraceae bacterium]|nr:UbiH/UbiF/VisC/COQ6 family ubiquinone biosynthesis hydroxylase [Caulobacteraceae bacterium]
MAGPAAAADDAPDRFDVVVVGAGMAGATAALGLAQGDLRVALVEPTPFEAMVAPAFDGRASAISFSCFRQWRALGAAADIAAHAQPIHQILVTDGRSPGASAARPSSAWLRFDSSEIADRSDGEPLGWLIENRHIRSGLAAAVRASPISLFAEARVMAVTAGPGASEVVLDDGRTLQAPLVVAADGRSSPVRGAAGIGVGGWSYPAVGVVATVGLGRDHNGVAYEHFLPSGPFAILPITDRRASLVWTERPERGRALMAARQEVFEAHLRRRFGGFLGEIEVLGPRFAYPLGLQLADQITSERLALIGDAAHAVHPIAGQGLNMGLKDAAALAEVIVDAARLGEDIGSATVLARYARWRSVDNLGVALATDVFHRLFSTNHPLIRAARGLGLAAVNRTGVARRAFMHEAGGAAGDLPRLLRGEAV